MKLLILEGLTVCASWLNQALYSLFTTKFSFVFFLFPKNFCINYVPEVQNVAYIFPSHGLRLEWTSDNYGNYAFCCSSPGFSKDGVYQSLLIIKQAPLEKCESPPSSLTFRLMLILFWWIILLLSLCECRTKHRGISNPRVDICCGVIRSVKVSFIAYLYFFLFYFLI